MSDYQAIEVGQTWRHMRTGKLVRITRYNAEWDDACYRWVEGRGSGRIYGCFLRTRYTLEDAEA